jgi:(E)-4-hydroxy-3-methylbut-2-enyl-diphosphate synthase
VFIDGKKAATLRGATLSADFKQMVIDYIERRWGQAARAAEPTGLHATAAALPFR